MKKEGNKVSFLKKSEFIVLGFILFSFLLFSQLSYSATSINECQTLNSAGTIYELANNVNGSKTCFNITADDISLDCKGYIINYSYLNSGFGINVTGIHNFTIRNCNFTYGSNLASTYAIYIDNSNGTVHNNIYQGGYFDIYNGTGTTFFNNTFIDLKVPSMISYKWVGNSINTTSNFITINRPNNTIPLYLDTMNITLIPYEESFGNMTYSNGVISNFTLSNIGTYHSLLNITDDFNNTLKITEYDYKVDEVQNNINYYIRETAPTHGQLDTTGQDWGVMNFIKPLTGLGGEYLLCTSFIEFFPDAVYNNISLGTITDFSITSWFKSDLNMTLCLSEDMTVPEFCNYSSHIPASPSGYSVMQRNMSINWTIYNLNDWYYHFIVFINGSVGASPRMVIADTNASHVNITYNYTLPISVTRNSDFNILSSTSPITDKYNTTVIFEGSGTTNITVQMTNSSIFYYGMLNDNLCYPINDANNNCTIMQDYYTGLVNLIVNTSSGNNNISIFGKEMPVDFTVCSAGCNFTSINDCLDNISRQPEGHSCVINGSGSYSMSASHYNITSIYPDNANSSNGGIIKITQSNVTLDLGGTRFSPFDLSKGYQWMIFTERKNNIYNVTIKNFDSYDYIDNNIENYSAVKNGMYHGAEYKDGINNLSLYNIKGNIDFISGDYINFINITGNIVKYNTNLNTTNNITVINSTGNLSLKSGFLGNSYIKNYQTAELFINISSKNVTVDNMTLIITAYPFFSYMGSMSALINSNIYHGQFNLSSNNTIKNIVTNSTFGVESSNIIINSTFNSNSFKIIDNNQVFNSTFWNMSTVFYMSNGNNLSNTNFYSYSRLTTLFKMYHNNTIEYSTIIGNTSGNIIEMKYGYDNKISHNFINKTSDYTESPCLYSEMKGTFILNNTFSSSCKKAIYLQNTYEIRIINNTFNETGNQTTGFFMNKIGLRYNNIDYNNVVIISAALATEAINSNNTKVTIFDGTDYATLFLVNDTGNYFGYGAGANITLWADKDFPFDCSTFTSTLSGGGYSTSCVYWNNSGAMYNQGATSNYVYNITDPDVIAYQGTPNINYNGYFFQTGFPIYLKGATNSNITGNKFYNTNTNMTAIEDYPTSKNNTFWNNYFYASGFNQSLNNSGCYNKIGNYYTDYDTLILAQGECGLQEPSVSISPSAPTTLGLHDIITLTCDGSDDMNGTSLDMSMGGTSVCSVNPTTGTTKTTSCTYDFEATSLGILDFICSVSDKATNLVTKTTTITVRSSTGSNPPPSTGPSSKPITIINNKEDVTVNKGTSISFSEAVGYSLKVDNLLDNSIDFSIYSGDNKLLTDTIELKSSKQFDLDGDGNDDVMVTLNGITLNKADITIQKLEGISKVKSGESVQEEVQKISNSTLIILLIIIIAMVGSFIGYYIYSKKK